MIPIQKPTQFALPLNFALPVNRAASQQVPGASPESLSFTQTSVAPSQSQIEPQPVAQPAGLTASSRLLTGTSTNQPLTEIASQTPAMAPVRLPQPQTQTDSLPQAATVTVAHQAPVPAATSSVVAQPGASHPDLTPAATTQPQPQTETNSLPQAATVTATQQAPVPTTTSFPVAQAGPSQPGITSQGAPLTALPQQPRTEEKTISSRNVMASPRQAEKEAKPDAPALPAATQPQPAPATDPIPQPSTPAPGVIGWTKPEDLAPLNVASQQPVASPEPPVPVAGPVPQKAPIRPPSGWVPSSRETVAPKSGRQALSQPPANWVPAAIPRSMPVNPSPGIAPSTIQQESKPATELSQSKVPPAPAGGDDPQPLQTQPEAIPQMVGALIAQPLSGELAFALKVTPQETAAPAAESGDGVKTLATSSPAQVVPVKEARRADNDGTLADGAPQHEIAHETPLPNVALPVAEKPAAPSVSVPEAHTATPLHANPAEGAQLSETPEAKPPQPVKQLSIQVGQDQQQRVELRVVERSGELQVSVRAANPDLAQGLRQGLSDLVGQLGQSGFHADAWRPGATAGTMPAAAEKPQTQAGSPNNNSQSQSGSQQDRQQGNQNPSRRPQWVEELETTSAGSGDRIPGETYGISR